MGDQSHHFSVVISSININILIIAALKYLFHRTASPFTGSTSSWEEETAARLLDYG